MAGRIAKEPPIGANRADADKACSGILSADSPTRAKHLNFCHQHNLVDSETAGAERRFGIRISLPPGDTLRKILGEDWEMLHWYATEDERDRVFESMATRHGYYRRTDTPTQILEKVLR